MSLLKIKKNGVWTEVWGAVNEAPKSCYGVDANKTGNVELVFGVKPIVLISFTVTDRYGIGDFPGGGSSITLQAEENMTWEQWINSEYNNCTPAFTVAGNYVKVGSGYIYNPDYSDTKPSDILIKDGEYIAGN